MSPVGRRRRTFEDRGVPNSGGGSMTFETVPDQSTVPQRSPEQFSVTRQSSTRFDDIWAVLDEQVEDGHLPGYAAMVRIAGESGARAGGRQSLSAGSRPMAEDSLFRIAS